MKLNTKLTSTQWFILLWFAGFAGLALIAGLIKLMMKLAY